MYTLKELKALPTLCVGQVDNLKIDNGKKRVWLSRCRVEDGEPYNNKVTVEEKDLTGLWVETQKYEAK